jgi:hypothetical protein
MAAAVSILYCLLSTKKKHVTIASGFQSKMKVKNIANLVSFLVSSQLFQKFI